MIKQQKGMPYTLKKKIREVAAKIVFLVLEIKIMKGLMG